MKIINRLTQQKAIKLVIVSPKKVKGQNPTPVKKKETSLINIDYLEKTLDFKINSAVKALLNEKDLDKYIQGKGSIKLFFKDKVDIEIEFLKDNKAKYTLFEKGKMVSSEIF